jgi:succinate dehydrogenase / fumarate reductase, flavoprotein subunit
MAENVNMVSTDVLVIGGGIGGLCAANKAVDEGVKVLIAEKGSAAWGGQIPSAGGSFLAVPPDSVDMQVKFVVEEGEYLNDQKWTETFVRDTYPCILEMASWGDLFPKDISGKLMYTPKIRLTRTEMCLPTLLKRAIVKGAKVLNKVYVADLLKKDGRVVGAIGFHYQTGDLYVIQSKATILACGGSNYKARALFHMNCGEAVAMAYHAGAELRNAEFGNTFMLSNKYTCADDRAQSSVIDAYENAVGESLVKKYPELNPLTDARTPPWMGGLIFRRWVRAMYREMIEGRGPIYLNLTNRPDLADMRYAANIITHQNRTHGFVRMMHRVGIDVTRQKVEWAVVPEFHAGPVRIGLDCATTVPGLYAIGDACQNGSGYTGALEGCGLTGGTPLSFAAVTGFRAGTAAGRAAGGAPDTAFNAQDANRLTEEIRAPLAVREGYSPYQAIKEIQEIAFKLRNSYVKHKDRLNEAIASIEDIKMKLPTLSAKDSHELVRCHEARSMALNAEILYRASLLRTETRGTNIREDCPARDDKNWLKWIIVTKENGRMAFRTEPVPIESYRYKPGC